MRQKKKVKEKKTIKVKAKDIGDDGGGWTEVKGSSSTVSKKDLPLCSVIVNMGSYKSYTFLYLTVALIRKKPSSSSQRIQKLPMKLC